MSHKVIDLASDDEKAKPIDLANSSDDDVEEIDDDDLQFACPRCTLLCARDVDVCVACTYEFRPPVPPPPRRKRTAGPSSGFRIPTRSEADTKRSLPDCVLVAASKRAKTLQQTASKQDRWAQQDAMRDLSDVSFPDPLAGRRGTFADDAAAGAPRAPQDSLQRLPPPSAAAAAAGAIQSTAAHAAAGLRSSSDTERMRSAVDAWDTTPKPLTVPPRRKQQMRSPPPRTPQTRSVVEMLNCSGAAAVKPVRVPVPALGADAWVLRGSLGAEVRSWSKIYVPLIFCALGDVPEGARTACEADCFRTQYCSARDDVRRANEWWSRRLSKWPDWCAAVRAKVITGDEEAFRKRFLENCKGKTAAVFNNPKEYGWLPHPPARLQEAVVREAGVDGELALMCLAATAKNK